MGGIGTKYNLREESDKIRTILKTLLTSLNTHISSILRSCLQ